MRRSIKSIIAATAAAFMCAVPAATSFSNVPVTTSITASAASQYPVALDYMGKGYAANGLLYHLNGTNSVALAGQITNVSIVRCPAYITIDNKNYAVTKIEAEAFRVNSVDDHPDWINEYHHFIYSTSIRTVDLTAASNLTEIGDRAFQYQTFGTLKMPTNSALVTIGNGAFEGCGNIDEADIPKTVRNIRADAFRYSGLEILRLNGTAYNSLSIESNAFADCRVLDKVVNDRRSVAGSNRNAFDRCKSTLKNNISTTQRNIGWKDEYINYFKSKFNFSQN